MVAPGQEDEFSALFSSSDSETEEGRIPEHLIFAEADVLAGGVHLELRQGGEEDGQKSTGDGDPEDPRQRLDGTHQGGCLNRQRTELQVLDGFQRLGAAGAVPARRGCGWRLAIRGGTHDGVAGSAWSFR